NQCLSRLAAMVAGAALCVPFPSVAGDPKAIIRAGGLGDFADGGRSETSTGEQTLTSKEPAKRPAEFAGKDGVLALFDGRVVSGKVTNTPGGYLLKRPGATDEMLPTFLVQTASDSLI